MNLLNVGNIGTHIKNIEKQNQWRMKEKIGDFFSHKKSLDEWISEAQEKSYDAEKKEDKANSKDKQLMYSKLESGKKLSQQEMSYLQKNDPQAYAKAKAIEDEREAYKRELRNCRTKEDVERLKMSKLAASLSVVNEVKSNSSIPEEKKLEYIMQENTRVKTNSTVW